MPRAGLHKNGTRHPPHRPNSPSTVPWDVSSIPRRGSSILRPRPARPKNCAQRTLAGKQEQRPAHPGRLKTAPSAPWPAKNSAQRTLAVGKMPATAGPGPDLVGPVEAVASPAPRAPKTAPSAPWPAKKIRCAAQIIRCGFEPCNG